MRGSPVYSRMRSRYPRCEGWRNSVIRLKSHSKYVIPLTNELELRALVTIALGCC